MTYHSNDRKIPIRTLLGILSLGICALSLTACVADYASDDNAGVEDYHDRHPIILAQAPTSVDVFPVGGGLDSLSIAKIRAFAERYRELGSGQITILAPAGRLEGRGNVVNEIRRTLYSSGVRGYVSVGYYPVPDPTLASPVRLVFQGLRARVPSHCGQWPSDLASGSSIEGWKNTSYENFGCATQSALAAQVDDPRDLAESRASAPPDEDMRLRAIGNVRKGEDPGTDWKTQTTTIGTIGAGG
jgi:pilus assembly protein CpaD